MPRTNVTPKLCRQREQSTPDRAFVLLNGRKIHLGRWGSKRARTEYHRLLAEWVQAQRTESTTLRLDRVLGGRSVRRRTSTPCLRSRPHRS